MSVKQFDIVAFEGKRWMVTDVYFKSTGDLTFIDILSEDGKKEHVYHSKVHKLGRVNLYHDTGVVTSNE